MDQLKMLEDFQTIVDHLDTDNDRLAELILISALISEAILSGILFQEYVLIKKFNEDISSTACEKAEFNQSVIQLLESACCLEEAFARKLEAAHALKRLAAAAETQEPFSSELDE
ncbi:hypothetical protein [Sporosarcina trichiuri]|uniref:hypothetical protein n=1 Tax=Sporosarcina trichiuri TaxID=3056445 RepID=UPI0025B2F3C9|nr:hypothetical protein [Sporosarcina sp. 0.2-SM1T-5]WJY26142.1 hypothetical protein QWT68_08585 [Sporosarcina sp. 0.2-SM1T-5]